VLDAAEPALLGVPAERQLDALVFASPAAPFRDVMVAGRWVLRDRRLVAADPGPAFAAAMAGLWATG
jgi:formimidoylglutamate deiminase